MSRNRQLDLTSERKLFSRRHAHAARVVGVASLYGERHATRSRGSRARAEADRRFHAFRRDSLVEIEVDYSRRTLLTRVCTGVRVRNRRRRRHEVEHHVGFELRPVECLRALRHTHAKCRRTGEALTRLEDQRLRSQPTRPPLHSGLNRERVACLSVGPQRNHRPIEGHAHEGFGRSLTGRREVQDFHRP